MRGVRASNNHTRLHTTEFRTHRDKESYISKIAQLATFSGRMYDIAVRI